MTPERNGEFETRAQLRLMLTCLHSEGMEKKINKMSIRKTNRAMETALSQTRSCTDAAVVCR